MSEKNEPSELAPRLDFHDALNRPWSLALNLGTVRRLKDDADFDLLDSQADVLREVVNDPMRLIQVLWVIVEPQAKANEVEPESFVDGFDGPTLTVAIDALLAAIVDFFRYRPSHRATLETAIKKMKQVEDQAAKMLTEKMNGPEVDEAITRELEAAGKKLTDSLASLDLDSATPTD